MKPRDEFQVYRGKVETIKGFDKVVVRVAGIESGEVHSIAIERQWRAGLPDSELEFFDSLEEGDLVEVIMRRMEHVQAPG